jgi:hypothetical protein
MKRLLPHTLLAVLACAAAAAPARADLISWTYNTTPSVTFVPATSSSQSAITFGNTPSGHGTGGSDIVLAGLTATSSASSPDTFSHTPWSVSLLLTDTASGQSATMTFTGEFNGTLSSLSSGITNTFTGLTTQSATLGNNIYTVTATSFVPPSVPNASNSGGLGAHVDVAVATPEPSTLLLCGLGAAGCALAGWRKRRQARIRLT